MSVCWMCGKSITEENKSYEHIFLNAIGGVLKSDRLLCKICNNKFGDSIDSSLAKALNLFANFLDIKRSDGKNPPPIDGVNELGEEYILRHGAKPEMKKPKIDDQGNIHARNKKEAQTMLRKFSNIDLNKSPEIIEHRSERINEFRSNKVKLEDEYTLSAICKMAVNFYMLHDGDRDNIINLIPYIKNNQTTKIIGFYYDHEVILKKSDQIVHGIILKSDSKNHILYAYIEFFNTVRYIVVLNDDYKCADLEIHYFFDVLERKEVCLDYHLSLSLTRITELLSEENPPYEAIQYKICQFFNLLKGSV